MSRHCWFTDPQGSIVEPTVRPWYHPAYLLGGIPALKHEDASLFSPPGAFGPFRVMHQIGIGVLGPVFRTYDPESDRLVAVKAFSLDFLPEQAEIFVEALKRIVDVGFAHPTIVTPLDAGLEEGVPFLATEYVMAESLDVAVHHVAPAPADQMIRFVGQLAAAVDAAHARGVMHGGLHARDVFVAPEITRVNGFGVASALEHVGLKVPVRRPFTAPEIVAGRSWGPEADRFAVATIAYEFLTGKRLAGTGDEVLTRLVAVESVNVADPSGLQQAFRNALADDPAIRPASAAGFVMALGEAVGFSSDEMVLAMSGRAQEVLPDFIGVEADDSEDASGLLRDERKVVETSHQDEPAADVNIHTEFVKNLDEVFELSGSVEEDSSLAQIAGRSHLSGFSIENVEKEPDTAAVDVDGLGSAVTEDKRETDISEQSETKVIQQVTEQNPMLPLELEAGVEDGSFEEETEVGSDQLVSSGVVEEDLSERFVVAMIEKDEVETGVVSPSAKPISSSGNRLAVASDKPVESASSSTESFSSKSLSRSLTKIASALFAMVVGITLAYMASVGLGTTTDDEMAVPVAETPEEVSLSPGDTQPLLSEQPDEAVPLGRPSSNELEDITPVSGEISSGLNSEVSAITESPELASSSVDVIEPSPIPEDMSSVPALIRESSSSFGWLLVRTEPPGANVSIDGDARGLTPLSLSEMPNGVYQLEVSVPGYKPEQRTVEISSDETIAAVSIVLDRFVLADADIQAQSTEAGLITSGSVFVDSRPTGASVFLDGASVGVTPVLVSDVLLGSHEVRIVGDGYRPWFSTVLVEDGQRSRVAASLEPRGRR